MGKKGKETLADKPGIKKTAHLPTHAWVRAPTLDAVISCYKLTNKMFGLPWKGTWIFQDACGTKNSFFVFWKQRLDDGNGEISMNRIKVTFLFLIRLKGRNSRAKFWSCSSKAPESWIGGSKMWRAFKTIFDPRRGYLYKVVKAPLPFSPRGRTTRVVLVTRISQNYQTPQKIYVTTS